MRAWTRPLIWIAAAALVAAVLRRAGVVEPAWAVVCVVLAGLLVEQLLHAMRLARWLRDPSQNPFPRGTGWWDDVFARLYHHERHRDRQVATLTHTLAGFRSAAQAMPDGVVALDADLRIDWLNGIAEQHLHLDLKADRGQSIINLMRHPEFIRYAESEDWHEPLILRGARGDDRVLHMQLLRYGGQQKLLLTRDITQVDRLETMRRDFVANVSHELRTPLTVLAGFVETLRDMPEEALSAAQRARYLDLMQDQSARMQALIADLLTLSSLESSPVDEPRRVAVAPLIQRLREQIEALSAGRHRFTWAVDAHWDLLGTEAELSSAFSNLLTNAVRYTPEGGHIDVSWQRVGDGCCFMVKDNGIGIAPQHIPRLTERFYRIDRSRSRETGGTGLGLAIVKHVLLRHEARLQVQSEPGRGTTFEFVFPETRVVAAE
jgi:two-component system phosphate regulon sensor histidine kinase PhoR